MFGWSRNISVVSLLSLLGAGCTSGVPAPEGGGSNAAAAVGAKALEVAAEIGGTSGFGGALMDGYVDHMPDRMGFRDADDLASGTEHLMILVRNDSDEGGTFHISYAASHLGLEDRVMDIEVGAGEEASVEIPCSEIVGMGPLDAPGEAGCHLSDDETVDNTMAVPGFLDQDFTCEGAYGFVLAADLEDLDGDGDTGELIITSDALQFHRPNGGPTGHSHGDGPGMMGSHMGVTR